MTRSITDTRYDVLVVGAGPSGLTTALAATRAGARVLVVDRHAGTTIFPKATGLRPRTMELMRTWGLEDEVRAGSQDLKVAGAIQPVLTGPVLQEFPIAAAAPDVLARMSPTTFAVAPQDHLEPVLLAQLRELGGEVRFGVRVASRSSSTTTASRSERKPPRAARTRPSRRAGSSAPTEPTARSGASPGWTSRSSATRAPT